MVNWKVQHLCERQLRDINPSDILCNGLYRQCDIYKGGGGYDKFEAIWQSRNGSNVQCNKQFVVQLHGCPLRCPYCYVTPDGINSNNYTEVSTSKLVSDFNETGLPVFHLMGGAPALYIEDWYELLDAIDTEKIFHSDLLLIEKKYSKKVIEKLASYNNSLYAVSIKGSTPLEFKVNTACDLNSELLWGNLDILVDCEFPFYLTFTGMTPLSVDNFKQMVSKRYGSNASWVLEDSFALDIIHYNALD